MVWGSKGHAFFFTLANFLVYFERGLANGFLPRLLSFFGQDQKSGGLINSFGIAGFMIGAPLAGPLARCSSHPVLVMGYATILMCVGDFWMGINTFSKQQAGFQQVLASRFFNGVGEAWFCTLAPPILDDVAHPDTKSLTIGLYFTAIPIGLAMGMALTFPFSNWSTGRLAFLGIATMWATLAAYYLLRSKDFSKGRSPDDSEEQEGTLTLSFDPVAGSFTGEVSRKPSRKGGSALRQTISSVQFWLVSIGYGGQTWFIGGATAWAIQYIEVLYGFRGQMVVGGGTVFTALIGSSLGGHMVDVLSRRRSRIEACCLLNFILMALCVPCVSLLPLASSMAMFFIFFFSSQFLAILAMSPINIGIMESVAPEARGLALGLATFIMHLFGDVPSAYFYGLVADDVSNTKIDQAHFDTNGLDQTLFQRECTLDHIKIYLENATLDADTMSAVKGNPSLERLVSQLQKDCDRAGTCVRYGELLQDSCREGQRFGFLLLAVGIFVCTLLFAISWILSRRKSRTVEEEIRLAPAPIDRERQISLQGGLDN